MACVASVLAALAMAHMAPGPLLCPKFGMAAVAGPEKRWKIVDLWG